MTIEKKITTVIDDIRKQIVPKLKRGLKSGRVELTDRDCDGLLTVLATSVSLEPFLDLFVKMMHSTIAEFDDLEEFKKSQRRK